MKMLRIAALLMALVLCLCAASALAETQISEQTFNWYGADLNTATGTLMVRLTRDSGYVLMDRNGNPLSNLMFTDVRANDEYYRVAVTEGVNVYGVIDAAGNELVPMQYGDVKFVGGKWMLCPILESATEENYDYKTYGNDKQFFLVSRYDVYFGNQMVGSIDRVSYDYATVHGDYIWIRSKAGDYTAYDPQFNARPVDSSSEFSMKSKVVTHNATGLQAFTADCTLTSDAVDTDVYEIGNVYYDLQGNALFTDDHYIIYSFYGDYAKTRSKDGSYGLIDKAGSVVLAEEYEDINLANSSNGYFPAGYQLVVKDGKLGFVSLADGSVQMTKYPSGAKYNNYGPFAFLQDLDGTYIVLSGAVGELPTHYADIRSNYQSTSPMFVAQNEAGETGVIGLAGEIVMPFSADHTRLYEYDFTYDGTLLMLRDSDYNSKTSTYTYHIYQISYELPAVSTEVAVEPTVDATPAPGSWTCEACGASNTGKFCSECGSAKPEPTPAPTPVASDEWTCACGSVNTGKFCPECGAAKPAADWTCSCGTVNTGKFCPECGSPRP